MNACEDDAVIFVGHGCVGAIQKLIEALDFREPPIVFTSPSEHPDNLMQWQGIGAKVRLLLPCVGSDIFKQRLY